MKKFMKREWKERIIEKICGMYKEDMREYKLINENLISTNEDSIKELEETVDENEKLRKEIEMYQLEHEKQEMFQNSIYKEKQSYKELYEILTEKYKKLNLVSKGKDAEIEDLKDSLKQYARNTFSRIGEVEKLKRDIIHLKKEREILYENSNDDSFVDKVLGDKKLYYAILSTLIVFNVFLFKIM